MDEQKDETKLRAKTYSDMLEQAYNEGREEHRNSVSVQLLELPEHIKVQATAINFMTEEAEKVRLVIEECKNNALELVLCVTITENGKTKEKYTNDKTRNLAVQQLLREDKLYLDGINELERTESILRKEQIQLDYLQNQFRAYIAIAGMNGVR